MLTLMNINILGVLVLVCPVNLCGQGVVTDVVTTIVVLTHYYVCGRCVPEE